MYAFCHAVAFCYWHYPLYRKIMFLLYFTFVTLIFVIKTHFSKQNCVSIIYYTTESYFHCTNMSGKIKKRIKIWFRCTVINRIIFFSLLGCAMKIWFYYTLFNNGIVFWLLIENPQPFLSSLQPLIPLPSHRQEPISQPFVVGKSTNPFSSLICHVCPSMWVGCIVDLDMGCVVDLDMGGVLVPSILLRLGIVQCGSAQICSGMVMKLFRVRKWFWTKRGKGEGVWERVIE